MTKANVAGKPALRSPNHAQSKYHFAMTPYLKDRSSKCPQCERKTGQRKVPLFIHIEPRYPILLNYTCRYCDACNLLVANQPDIEHLLTQMFLQADPSAIGNKYEVVGIIERSIWAENMKRPKPIAEMLDSIQVFKSHIIAQRTMGGWFRVGVEPPVEPAPPSREWVKSK